MTERGHKDSDLRLICPWDGPDYSFRRGIRFRYQCVAIAHFNGGWDQKKNWRYCQ